MDSSPGTSSALKVGSLFAGIGGFDLGFERAGLRTVWVVESNPFCQFVLKKHFPHARRYNDVRYVSAANLDPIDVLCGGFPCQDISIGNRSADGISGKRSSLWGQFARLIEELSPRYVVIENSPMLVRRGIDRVLRDLSSLGYDAEWTNFQAAWLGAPHIRTRIFIVAYSPCEGLGGSRGEPRLLTQKAWRSWRGRNVGVRDWWAKQSEPPRVADGFPNRLDEDFKPRVQATGNALVPQIAEFLGWCIMKDHETRHYSSRPSPDHHLPLH